MTEINPFSRSEIKKSIEINDNYTESASENDYPIPEFQSFNSIDSSYPESPKKRFPNFPIKSIFSPELFLEQTIIEKLICGICENVCDEAVKIECKCGNIFCKKCLEFYLKKMEEKCPLCQKATKGKIIDAKAENMLIKSQKMKCVNYINNCKWEGECREYKDHITVYCPVEIMNCPNKIHGCVIKVLRKDILDHLKQCEYDQIKCEKCMLHFPKKDTYEHKNFCLMEKILCPYNCGKIFERKDLEIHKNKVCEKYEIECPYKLIGCEDVFKKREEKKRLNEEREKHMNLLMKKLLSLDQNFSNCEQRIKNIENDIQFLKHNNNTIMNNNLININNNETDITLLSRKRKYSTNKEDSYEFRSNEEEKNGDYLPKINIYSDSISNIEDNEISIQSIEKGKKKEEETIYDLLEFTKNKFFVNKNLIEAMDLNGKHHFFVFFKKEFDIPRLSEKTYKIRFKLLSNAKQLFMGLCDKKLVEEKNYEFSLPNNAKEKKGKKANNGIYYLNTNKMAWNCNNMSQCKNLKINDDINIAKKENTFEFIITPIDCVLEIKLNAKTITKFSDVRCFKSTAFSPFLIFLNNSKVETSFIYK